MILVIKLTLDLVCLIERGRTREEHTKERKQEREEDKISILKYYFREWTIRHPFSQSLLPHKCNNGSNYIVSILTSFMFDLFDLSSARYSTWRTETIGNYLHIEPNGNNFFISFFTSPILPFSLTSPFLLFSNFHYSCWSNLHFFCCGYVQHHFDMAQTQKRAISHFIFSFKLIFIIKNCTDFFLTSLMSWWGLNTL